jgi:hypothetical protein
VSAQLKPLLRQLRGDQTAGKEFYLMFGTLQAGFGINPKGIFQQLTWKAQPS